MLLLRSLLVLSSVAGSVAARHDPFALHRRADVGDENAMSNNTTDIGSKRFIVEFHEVFPPLP